nr:hypothetical protein [Tanacetum cinerariifolium]
NTSCVSAANMLYGSAANAEAAVYTFVMLLPQRQQRRAFSCWGCNN